ncbi:hypothetical protein CYMTET_41685 [Cymbomonas tetramitiformis]|uniref:Uncharacterized protein n=1 Tax=Cymbomonas tetramitiformis TaxID=36881 RepID=A0AAE0C5M1_9CHLO|nr:hypothetical protein CYMTET_41685 [Cymbomonas tetramitiformis]
MVRGDFTILQPEENTAPITLEESKTSMSNLFKFLVQAEPMAWRHTTSDGDVWILLCPPEWQNHAATTSHFLQGCTGRDDARHLLRAHNIANVPDSVILPIIQACPTCLINKCPPSMRQTTAITIKDAKRVQFWDIGENNEGTNTILHTIDDPGNHHDIYHVQTEKARLRPRTLSAALARLRLRTLSAAFVPSAYHSERNFGAPSAFHSERNFGAPSAWHSVRVSFGAPSAWHSGHRFGAPSAWHYKHNFGAPSA